LVEVHITPLDRKAWKALNPAFEGLVGGGMDEMQAPPEYLNTMVLLLPEGEYIHLR
jgi:hypothetical protein